MKVIATIAAPLGVAFLSLPSAAQSGGTPGVTEIAPGVRHIDGSKVPSIDIDRPALEEAIKEGSFRDVRRMLGGSGLENVGPANTVTHMYKVRDRATSEEMVLILFVRGQTILDYLFS